MLTVGSDQNQVNIFSLGINRQIQLPGRAGHKFSITIRIRAAQAVIQMGDGRSEGIFRRQDRYNMDKGNGIRTARNLRRRAPARAAKTVETSMNSP